MTFPSNWTRVEVTGKYIMPTGEPAKGKIEFSVYPHSRIVNSSDNTIVVPEKISVVLDAQGSFSVLLPSTNDPDISPHFKWHIMETFEHNRRFNYYIELPWDLASLDLSHAIELVPQENLFAYVKRSGDSMTGFLSLFDIPVDDKHAANKGYVDELVESLREEIPDITRESVVIPFPTPIGTWSVNHNLGRYPQVSILDSNNELVESDIIYNSLNSVTVIFQEPTTGKAVLT